MPFESRTFHGVLLALSALCFLCIFSMAMFTDVKTSSVRAIWHSHIEPFLTVAGEEPESYLAEGNTLPVTEEEPVSCVTEGNALPVAAEEPVSLLTEGNVLTIAGDEPLYYVTEANSSTECLIPYEEDGQVEGLMAYLILAFDRYTMQGAKELIYELYNPYDTFVFHIDAKVPSDEYTPWRESFKGCENVLFIRDEKRLDVQWASWEIVGSELLAIYAALESKRQWQYAQIMDGKSCFASLLGNI